MKKYLITIDLDGTLMLDFMSYDEETFKYLRKLAHDGHKIIIATGRPFRSSHFIYQALELDTPLINYNGAYITNPKDDHYPITDVRIRKDDLFSVIDVLGTDFINGFCEIHDEIFVHNYDAEIHFFLHVDGGTLLSGNLKTILQDDPHGALLFVKRNAIKRIEEYIEKHCDRRILSRYWHVGGYDIVEIYHPAVDKAQGMLEAAKYYQIDQANIIAIGDGHNDIGMIKEATIGVAMKDAHPELKSIAKYHTDSYEAQGVLKFLKAFFK